MRNRFLFGGLFIYALFLSWGIPLWDDDFTSWISQIWDKNLAQLLWEVISPLSTQPEHWGFNERPLQKIFYKIGWYVSGKESWAYWVLKCLGFAGLGVAVYRWALLLVPKSKEGRWAALGASLFLMASPGVTAAFVLHMDFAIVAELLFVVLTYVLIGEVERTPATGSGWLNLRTHGAWLKRWTLLSLAVYLSYKSKADLKLIPVILAVYVFILRRSQLRWFAFPIGLMFILAIPWGPGIFSRLPAFMPGSSGSAIDWMWQPAKLARIQEFIWSSIPYQPIGSWSGGTLSLAGMLGPYLLVPLLIFLVWRGVPLDRVPWLRNDRLEDRARIFALIWIVLILGAVSSLPELNYVYRIRYGILTMVPVSLLLAWAFGVWVESWKKIPYPKVALGVMLSLFGIQFLQNLSRSLHFRGYMGSFIVAADAAYKYVEEKLPDTELYLLPDFRPNDYWPDMPRVLRERKWLNTIDELKAKPPGPKRHVISWGASLWEQLPLVAALPGCRSSNLFERTGFCPRDAMAFVMEYRALHPSFALAEKAKSQNRWADARSAYEQVLRDEPGNLGARFGLGFAASQQRDWITMEAQFGEVRKFFPQHLGVIYNHGVALKELGRYDAAAATFSKVIAVEPNNYASLIYLFWSYREGGRRGRAQDVARKLRAQFPQDPGVLQLPSD